eukprot:GILJ01009214.1.p1 GENE.GILJ01009214.1~~GILJ01009214.1.p1  ORF type:complete len:544 (+),score=91.96 GILJ01009214.1:1-1632(+)
MRSLLLLLMCLLCCVSLHGETPEILDAVIRFHRFDAWKEEPKRHVNHYLLASFQVLFDQPVFFNKTVRLDKAAGHLAGTASLQCGDRIFPSFPTMNDEFSPSLLPLPQEHFIGSPPWLPLLERDLEPCAAMPSDSSLLCSPNRFSALLMVAFQLEQHQETLYQDVTFEYEIEEVPSFFADCWIRFATTGDARITNTAGEPVQHEHRVRAGQPLFKQYDVMDSHGDLSAIAAIETSAVLGSEMTTATKFGLDMLLSPVLGGIVNPVIHELEEKMTNQLGGGLNDKLATAFAGPGSPGTNDATEGEAAQEKREKKEKKEAKAKKEGKKVKPDPEDGQTGMLTQALVTDLSNFMTPPLTKALTEVYSSLLHEQLKDLLVEHLEDYLKKEISTELHKLLLATLSASLGYTIPLMVNRVISGFLTQALTITLSKTVTLGVTHALHPTLTQLLRNNAQDEMACYYCHFHHVQCESCKTKSFDQYQSSYQHEYYVQYFSDYYAKIFAHDPRNHQHAEDGAFGPYSKAFAADKPDLFTNNSSTKAPAAGGN